MVVGRLFCICALRIPVLVRCGAFCVSCMRLLSYLVAKDAKRGTARLEAQSIDLHMDIDSKYVCTYVVRYRLDLGKYIRYIGTSKACKMTGFINL